jgi:hypothetical protein
MRESCEIGVMRGQPLRRNRHDAHEYATRIKPDPCRGMPQH